MRVRYYNKDIEQKQKELNFLKLYKAGLLKITNNKSFEKDHITNLYDNCLKCIFTLEGVTRIYWIRENLLNSIRTVNKKRAAA